MRIWELIETPRDIDAICAQLQKEYDVTPEACRYDVKKFLNELEKQGAIVIEGITSVII